MRITLKKHRNQQWFFTNILIENHCLGGLWEHRISSHFPNSVQNMTAHHVLKKKKNWTGPADWLACGNEMEWNGISSTQQLLKITYFNLVQQLKDVIMNYDYLSELCCENGNKEESEFDY